MRRPELLGVFATGVVARLRLPPTTSAMKWRLELVMVLESALLAEPPAEVREEARVCAPLVISEVLKELMRYSISAISAESFRCWFHWRSSSSSSPSSQLLRLLWRLRVRPLGLCCPPGCELAAEELLERVYREPTSDRKVLPPPVFPLLRRPHLEDSALAAWLLLSSWKGVMAPLLGGSPVVSFRVTAVSSRPTCAPPTAPSAP